MSPFKVKVPVVPVIEDPVAAPHSRVVLVGDPRAYEDKAKVEPAFTVKAALTVDAMPNEVVPEETVKLLNVVDEEPPIVCVVPLKLTVPLL
jgi:hypothetical protein